jgi:hypothetical protein
VAGKKGTEFSPLNFRLISQFGNPYYNCSIDQVLLSKETNVITFRVKVKEKYPILLASIEAPVLKVYKNISSYKSGEECFNSLDTIELMNNDVCAVLIPPNPNVWIKEKDIQF